MSENIENKEVKENKKSIKDALAEKGMTVISNEKLKQKETALSLETKALNPVMWAQFREMADTMIMSGALPKESNAEQLMVKMQAGVEMGMKPFEAIRSLYLVNGMIAIGGRDLIKQLRKHGWSLRYFDETSLSVSLEAIKGDEKYTETFTYDEAVKSGWTKTYNGGFKPAWIEGANRNLKMRYAVVSKLVKSYIPEVMGSATDVMEIIEDTQSIFSSTQEEFLEQADYEKIMNTKSFGELTAVSSELKKKYHINAFKDAYENKKKELTQ